jgi:hypothetical protein
MPAPFALGQNVITCYGFNATIVGLPGIDTLVGIPGRDIIMTLVGGDRVQTLDGDNIICGGDGYDTFIGGTGNDTLLGDGIMTAFMAAPSLALTKEISRMVTEDQTLICASMLRM